MAANGPLPPEKQALAERLMAERASQEEIARSLGLTASTIRSRFPGYRLTPEEISDRIRIAQFERRLKEKAGQAKANVR